MKKTNKKFVVILVAATLLVAGGLGFVLDLTDHTSSIQTNEFNDVSTIARVDLTTTLSNKNQPQFKVYLNGSKEPMREAGGWMTKIGKQGYIIQQQGSSMNFVIEPLNDCQIKLDFMGKDVHDESNHYTPMWVEYTSLTINGEEILDEETPAWLKKPFTHVIHAKAGENYTVSAKWKKHEVSTE